MTHAAKQSNAEAHTKSTYLLCAIKEAFVFVIQISLHLPGTRHQHTQNKKKINVTAKKMKQRQAGTSQHRTAAQTWSDQ
jgi:hypothetical protein